MLASLFHVIWLTPGRDGGLRRSSPLARVPSLFGSQCRLHPPSPSGLTSFMGKTWPENAGFFLPRFHAQFYNSLIINAPGNEAWPHPDSYYIRTDFKTGYDVLGDTSLVLSVKYSPAKAVPYLKGLSICFFIISIYISNTYLYTKFFVTKLFVKFLLRFS